MDNLYELQAQIRVQQSLIRQLKKDKASIDDISKENTVQGELRLKLESLPSESGPITVLSSSISKIPLNLANNLDSSAVFDAVPPT